MAKLRCPYCYADVEVKDFVQHDIEKHSGLERMRSNHKFVCLMAPSHIKDNFICNINLYEKVAWRIGYVNK